MCRQGKDALSSKAETETDKIQYNTIFVYFDGCVMYTAVQL